MMNADLLCGSPGRAITLPLSQFHGVRFSSDASVDQLDAGQFAAVGHLLEVMIQDDDEELSEEDRAAVSASREYFRKGGKGVPFEQVVAECGFTMDQIRSSKGG
jgi:hypothetical protein